MTYSIFGKIMATNTVFANFAGVAFALIFAAMSLFITTKKAAQMVGLTPRHMQRLCAWGKIPGAFRCGKKWFIPSAALVLLSDRTVAELEKNRNELVRANKRILRLLQHVDDLLGKYGFFDMRGQK